MKFSDPDQSGLEAHPAVLRSWARTLLGTIFFLLVQTGPKAHLVSCTLDIVFLSQRVLLTTLLEPKLGTNRYMYLHCACMDILRGYLYLYHIQLTTPS